MRVNGKDYHTIWLNDDGTISIVDQRWLPFEFVIEKIDSVDEMAVAISQMHLRGAIVIGVAGGYGVYLAAKESCGNWDWFLEKVSMLRTSRPTAVNLSWAVERVLSKATAIKGKGQWNDVVEVCLCEARKIEKEELERCRRIGLYGLEIIRKIYRDKNDTVNILTHCNAGWLACVDYGTATSPIYEAHRAGIPVCVWVDETRPRNQGCRLTSWELLQEGVPHTLIVDNAGGYLMQNNLVDLVIVGADRVSRRGDVANKIGTYLKALAARDNGIPFYVALPISSFDLNIYDGLKEIPIEERSDDEILYIRGKDKDGDLVSVRIAADGVRGYNIAFDVTPFTLVTAFITDKGIILPIEDEIVRCVGS